MGSSKKTKIPPPIDTRLVGNRTYSLDSAGSEPSSVSLFTIRDAVTRANRYRQNRTTSFSSDFSAETPLPTHSRHNSTSSSKSQKKPVTPTVNRHTHCGRHSNQFLFHGWSDIMRDMIKRE